MNLNSRPELDELLGAYALDAIEPVERYEMEQYLTVNDAARDEVDELRETAALLALLHTRRERVPEQIWENIESAIDRVDSDDDDGVDPVVVPLRSDMATTSVRRRRLSVPLPVAALLVAAASVAIVLLAARHNTNGRDMAAAFGTAARRGHEVTIADHGTTMAHVAFTDDGNGYLRADAMPALPAGKVYQLWVLAPGRTEPISAGVLGRKPHAYASFVFGGKVSAFAVSIENAPGAVTPTQPVGSGTL